MAPWWRAVLMLVGMTLPAKAAKIGELSDIAVLDQAMRFLTFQDPTVRLAVAGAALMGIACGVLGTFLVVRRLSLVGDTLSHAVLPGVAAGFLWGHSKNPVAIFVGAVVAGLAGTMVASAIRRTTRLKEDTALGLVLAGFYAVGICLVTMIQRLPTGNKSGIDKFLFGQAAAISAGDLKLMGAVTVLVLILVAIFYKELLVTSFDPAFARAAGFPVRLIQDGLMLLLAFAVVGALQAVGVVLVSAMLITPAAAAYLLTDRLRRMLLIASAIGCVTGVVGCFLSFLGNSLPTGPIMVLVASVVFALAFLFAPRHGLLVRWAKARGRHRRVGRENTLKALYHVLESRGFERDGVTLKELAQRRRETLDDADRQAKALVRHGLAVLEDDGQLLRLTTEGRKRASELVRNHRLWELYLTHAVRFAADHVHDDAEKIEHVLGEEVVWELERRLNYADTDPHGKRIPLIDEGPSRSGRAADGPQPREGGNP